MSFSLSFRDISVQEKHKSRRFPINFSASPLLGKKQSNSSGAKSKKTDAIAVGSVPKQESTSLPDRYRTKHSKPTVVSASIRPTKTSHLPATSTQDTQTSQMHVTTPQMTATATKKIDHKSAYEKQQRKELLGSTSPARPKDTVTV